MRGQRCDGPGVIDGTTTSDTLGFSETNIQNETLNIKQRKTDQKLRIPIVGRLAEVIERIRERKRELTKNGKKVISLALVINEHGRQLGKAALRARFDKARQVSGVDFQFRDIRAKSGTDLEDLAHAQKLLGHRNRATTERYLRKRRGESVAAVNKKL